MMDENIVKKDNDIDESLLDIQNSLLLEQNSEEIKHIVDMFNLNIQKKNILRLSKLNQIQDLITDEIEERVKNKSGEFNNQDLLNYFKTVQYTIDKSDSVEDIKNIPAISVTNNQLNINLEKQNLDKDSRERVLDAVKSILNKSINLDDKNNKGEIMNIE